MENVKGNEGEAVEGQVQQASQNTRSNGEENHLDSGGTTNGATEEVDAGGQGTTSGEPGLVSNLARMSTAAESFRYATSHKKRGHCVIFNHRYFDRVTGLGERNGTDRDRDQVKMLFSQLEFDVKVYDNLTVKEIQEILQDCKCNLAACRGEGLDSGVNLVRTRHIDEIDSGRLAYKIPTTADFLICWSTVPGHYSWRNTTNGSWFMQSLVHVLSKEVAHEDLLSIMTNVNRHMILNFESNTPSQQHMHGKKQSASIVSTLMRKVFLSPKY
ncbi:Caspase-1 [Portunus trituberculatus]|uniref:Caspase-1 n=1 Tax=Portunus trituberculatus TaxID=210409 RepID=A0A5B7CRN9_PORTR|nr:Caspase-1 [Portunus trituberculatus]